METTHLLTFRNHEKETPLILKVKLNANDNRIIRSSPPEIFDFIVEFSTSFLNQLQITALRNEETAQPALCLMGYTNQESRKTIFSENLIFDNKHPEENFLTLIFVGSESYQPIHNKLQRDYPSLHQQYLHTIRLSHKSRGILTAREWKRLIALSLTRIFAQNNSLQKYLEVFWVLDDDGKGLYIQNQIGASLTHINWKSYATRFTEYLRRDINTPYLTVSPYRNSQKSNSHMNQTSTIYTLFENIPLYFRRNKYT